jgi:hypothetical protein
MARTKLHWLQQRAAARDAARSKLHIPNKIRDQLFSLGKDDKGNFLYRVQKIVAHKRARDGSVEFNVKWTYFPDCRNTDETEDFIRRNPGGPAAIDSYKTAKGL